MICAPRHFWNGRLASLSGECVLVFDRSDHVSPNDDERMRCAGVGSTNYTITINSPLPSRDAILKNKLNKRQLSWVLSTFDICAAVTTDTHDIGVFGHEEADVTLISYVLQAVGEGKNVVKVWFYIALYPVRWTAQSALHFPPLADLFIPTPFSASLGSILAMQQLRNDYSLTCPPLSIARYSFIQLSRLRRREVKENAQTSKR